jgi:hypothetical protein
MAWHSPALQHPCQTSGAASLLFKFPVKAPPRLEQYYLPIFPALGALEVYWRRGGSRIGPSFGIHVGGRLASTAAAGRLNLINSASITVRTIALPQLGLRFAIVLGIALAISPTPALAETRVSGSPEAVTIEARDGSVEEVLAALSRTFDMGYHSSIDLDKRLNGTYVGPLSRVVTRILEGYSFVLKTDNGSVIVTVVGPPNVPAANRGGSASAALGAPRAPAPQSGQVAAAPGSRAGVAVEPNAGRRK